MNYKRGCLHCHAGESYGNGGSLFGILGYDPTLPNFILYLLTSTLFYGGQRRNLWPYDPTSPTFKLHRANNNPNIKSSQSKQQLQHQKLAEQATTPTSKARRASNNPNIKKTPHRETKSSRCGAAARSASLELFNFSRPIPPPASQALPRCPRSVRI